MIPKKMKALVLEGVNDYQVKDVDVPDPGYGEVLCAIEASAICGSEPGYIRGNLGGGGIFAGRLPLILGHEWAGRIVKIGPAVAGWRVGDRVVGEAHCGCGSCVNCKKGDYTCCLNYGKQEFGQRHYGRSAPGSFAEYAAYRVRSLTPLPDNVSFSEGATIDAFGAALHAVERTGITPGGVTAVIGPGPIGMVTAKLARSFGSSEIIMIGRGDRLKIAAKLCADRIIDFEKTDVAAQVLNMTAGTGADEVFECAGAVGTLNQAIQIVKKTGKIGVVGMPPVGRMEDIDNRKMILDEITLYGSRANPNVTHKLLAMVSSGTLSIKEMITHHFPLSCFAEALDCFVSRKDGALKVVIEPGR
jgi:L-iditol 2-dehydrogenase